MSDADPTQVSDLLKEIAAVMIAQIRDFDERIDHLHDRLTAWHRADEVSGRLATIPGIGPVTKDNDVMADGRQPGSINPVPRRAP